MTVDIRLGLVASTGTTTGRGSRRSTVAIIHVASRRRVVVDWRGTSTTGRWAVTVIAGIVIVPRRRGTTSVVIATRAVAAIARRTTAIVVIVHGRAAVSTTMACVATTTTVSWRAGTVTRLTRTRDLGLRLCRVSLLQVELEQKTHVGDAVDRHSLKVVLVKLLNSRLEVGSGLVLDETLATSASSVALTVDLTVDDVKPRLAGKVLQILVVVSVSTVEATRPSAGSELCPQGNRKEDTYLPAGLERKPGDRHTMNGATRARSHAFLSEARTITGAGATTSELDDQTLAHELRAV
jgi:hypothetical protein